jgi:hypothetical protein
MEGIASGLDNLAYLTIRFAFSSGQNEFFEILKQSIKEINIT